MAAGMMRDRRHGPLMVMVMVASDAGGDKGHGPLMVMVAGDAGGEERHGPLMELQLGKVGAGSSTNG